MNIYIIMYKDEKNKLYKIKKLMKRDNSVYLSMNEIEKMLLFCDNVDEYRELESVNDIFFDALETLLLSSFNNIIIEPYFDYIDNNKKRCDFIGSFFNKYNNVINKIFYVCGENCLEKISDKEINDYKIEVLR